MNAPLEQQRPALSDDETAVLELLDWLREAQRHEGVSPKVDICVSGGGYAVCLWLHGMPGQLPPCGVGHSVTLSEAAHRAMADLIAHLPSYLGEVLSHAG